MTTPGRQFDDQRFRTADELLHAITAGATPGAELAVAAQLEELAAKASGLRMAVLARAVDAESDDQKVIPVADQIHANNRCTGRRLALMCGWPGC